ncbi:MULTISPECIES: M3 family oligoendopeptidase [unclassified Clostridioides]|uniref:M3 family oligoendopeptidase n=1 Tax=unclassified Clostridioides TaxID=2635829 RepID=UPI001D1044FE|nr:M3 family oligoendopeptidase [Clostridioides sp. ZZV14-6150]MCC0660262.1 M3 family oligoendopeptidase [Clostridioides sp. ZZV14-6154]MCC0720938.1 M3 family oligoendopeptidase [Clostridioides sp. ZZV14-6104]MCC0741253.1 M3 family oligoendopeptidase [Clostridioides sp. ZZV14-6044]MCC0749434.1 M3 family oligoendopeptidase [Clostridioides sp. ZZV13-5731]WLD28733.1 Peptidase family M3 [Clostridioides difficile]
MKFSEFKYERPNYNSIKKEFLKCVEEIDNSCCYDEQQENIHKINLLRNKIETLSNISSIRYSINTLDKLYQEEKNYWDEYMPLYEELNTYFYNAIANSKFKSNLKKEFGEQFFTIVDYSLKSFSKEIIKELQEENKLCSEYTKLLASAQIMFEGEERNLSGMGMFMCSRSRKTRKLANKVYYNFFEENESKFDDIFDKLVKLRDKIAKKLGFKNFVELGYIRMMRSNYREDRIENFRKQVLKYIVPLADELYEKQAKRIGLESLSYIDEDLEFLTGNATLKGNSEYIIENGKRMYAELSKETDEFFDFMLKNELMDLETKKGKGAGGYCTYVPDYKSPFIFSNFNQTSDDIDVLTHEAGHAFQLYMSRWIEMPEINFPTLDSCEIHSMSMEFITWPWMELFFKEDTDKYKFTHLSSAIKFIPYGVVVDEFQHYIYKNPNIDKSKRKEIWRFLEKKYLPHRKYDDNSFLERGCWWFKQGHIFKNPFYYIDYALAQICALQFWKKMIKDKESGWNDYINICKVGGTKSFLDIVSIGNLYSPFNNDCIKSVIDDVKSWFDEINDINL